VFFQSKELTERVDVKNKSVIDKNCDNLETENKLVIFCFVSEKGYL